MEKLYKLCIIAGVLLVGISAVYYSVLFLPAKEKNDLQKAQMVQDTKLEEIKLEQEKLRLEEVKIQQEKEKTEAERLAEEEAKKQATTQTKSQTSSSSGLNTCLATADANYDSKLKKEKMCSKDYYCDRAAYAAIVNNLQNEKNQARNECYMRYR